MVAEAYEDGEEKPIIFAAASDYLNTVNAFLEPMDASVSVAPASARRTNPFGITDPFVAISPAPRTVDVSGITSLPLPPDIGIPEPMTAVIFMTGMVFQVIRRRIPSRRLFHGPRRASRVVPSTWKTTGTKAYPQILLRRHKL